MDQKSVREYINLLEESNLSSLKIKTDKGELHLTKEQKSALIPQSSVESSPSIRNVCADKVKKHTLNAPMVATFYRATEPGKTPFVSVGDEVKKGDVVCILEAMKVMNEIKSDRQGHVKEILVQDTMTVEFDQPLFVIE